MSVTFPEESAEYRAARDRLLEQLDGAAEHVVQRVNFAVVAKSALPRVLAFAKERGWRRLRILSSSANTYNRDYLGETAEGVQMPMLNVFRRDGEAILHFWGAELLYAPTDGSRWASDEDVPTLVLIFEPLFLVGPARPRSHRSRSRRGAGLRIDVPFDLATPSAAPWSGRGARPGGAGLGEPFAQRQGQAVTRAFLIQ